MIGIMRQIIILSFLCVGIHRSALQADLGIQDEGSKSTELSHGYKDKRTDIYHGIYTSNDNMQLEPEKNNTDDKDLHRYMLINNSETKYSFGPSKTKDIKTLIDNKRFEMKQGEEVEGETKGVRAAREPRSVQGNNSNSGVKVADENNHTGKEATNNHSLFIPSKPGIDFTTDDEMWINVSWGNLDQILKSLSNFGEDSPAMLPLEKSEENIETFMNQRLEDIKTPGERGYQDMYLEDDEKEEKKEAPESGMPLYFYSVTIPTFIAMAVMIVLCCVFLRPGGWCCQLFTAQSSTSLIEEEVDAQDLTRKKQTIV